jgi:predicted ATPase
MPRLVLSTLGAFQALLNGQPITSFRSDRTRALLIYLMVNADQPHTRDHLIGLLWPDEPETTARHNLRQALLVLRKALDDDHALPSHLRITTDAVQFNAQSDHLLDVAQYEALLAANRTHQHRRAQTCRDCLARLREATTLYRGDFLAQLFVADGQNFEEWTAFKREALKRTMLDALYTLAADHERRGEYEQAQQYASRQVALEPWREEAHRQLMRALALSGQRSAALAQYATCRRLLAEGLQVEPEAETQRLYADVRAGRLAKHATPMPNPTLPARAHTLIGREADSARIKTLLFAKRFVTLVGAGGVGKTRLAWQVAMDLQDDFEHGVWFVSLEALRDASLVSSVIAHTLGLTAQEQQSWSAALKAFLRSKQTLLVLDNFEQVAGAAPFIGELLAYAPRLEVLVTSREALHVQGEQVCMVAPLALPTLAHGQVSMTNLEQSAAVSLFVERVRAFRPDFALTHDHARALADICIRLDGLPLAIELAAARCKSLSPQQIAERLDQRLSLLTRGTQSALRQQTLRDTLDWSYELLSEAEQTLLHYLAVFAGGWTLAAAEKVASDSARSSPSTLDLLSQLVDKSLVIAQEQAGQMRYRLLETIREYALEKLQTSGAAADAQQRHATVYWALAREAQAQLRGREQARWLERLEREHDNLRAALGWVIAQTGLTCDALAGLQFALTLSSFWEWRTHLAEGRQWLERALQATPERAETLVWRARALGQAGQLANWQGDYVSAHRFSQEGLRLARACADAEGLRATLRPLALALVMREELSAAENVYDELLALERAHQDPHALATSLSYRAALALRQNDIAQTIAWHAEALALAESTEDERLLAVELARLGQLALMQQKGAQAAAYFAESLRYCRRLGDSFYLGQNLLGMAGVALLRQDYARAAQLAGAEEALSEWLGMTRLPMAQQHYEQALNRLRAQYDAAALAAAWAQGRAMTLEEAVSYALETSG